MQRWKTYDEVTRWSLEHPDKKPYLPYFIRDARLHDIAITMEPYFKVVDRRINETEKLNWKVFGTLSTANVVVGDLLLGTPESILWKLPVALVGIALINKVVKLIALKRIGLGLLAQGNDIRENLLLADMDGRDGFEPPYEEFEQLAERVKEQGRMARFRYNDYE